MKKFKNECGINASLNPLEQRVSERGIPGGKAEQEENA